MNWTLRIALALALAVLARPALASDDHTLDWGLDLTVHGGLDKYDAVGLKNGLQTTQFSSSSQLKDTSLDLGATAVLRLSLLELGAIGEIGRPGKTDATTVLGAMGGAGLDFASLRLEGLVELGGHRYGNVLKDSSIVSQSTKSVWLAYVGLRPGLSYRPADSRWILGVWAFARWDLTSQNVQVTLQNPGGTSAGSYKLGGSQFGGGLRAGFSL
jgi:hypothetical protein